MLEITRHIDDVKWVNQLIIQRCTQNINNVVNGFYR